MNDGTNETKICCGSSDPDASKPNTLARTKKID